MQIELFCAQAEGLLFGRRNLRITECEACPQGGQGSREYEQNMVLTFLQSLRQYFEGRELRKFPECVGMNNNCKDEGHLLCGLKEHSCMWV